MADKVIVIIKDERPSVPDKEPERTHMDHLAEVASGTYKSENKSEGGGMYGG